MTHRGDQDPEPEDENQIDAAPNKTAEVQDVAVEEILIEEVSIDGMCGVY